MYLKNILIIGFILLLNFLGFSQEQEVAPPFHIKTISFIQGSNNNVIPFFKLNDAFELQFDDLHANEADYYYSIEQFNFDWSPTQLLKSEYLAGQDNLRIQNYSNSQNTLQVFSHYKIGFPNKQSQIIKSGNYIIKITDDSGNLVFSRKFIIYEDILTFGMLIKRARDVENIQYKQNIEMIIDYKNQNLINPIDNLKLSLYQNGNFNTTLQNIKPQYTIGSQLIYRYNTETQFWAGNEFLNYENKIIRAVSNSVSRVTSGEIYNTYLYQNISRKNQVYTYFPDINGNFFVNNIDRNPELEADYAWVYFNLSDKDITPNSNIYINGMFNNFQMSDENKMDYNPKNKSYEKAMFIKQGFTNYQYLLTDKNNKPDFKNAIDGNFYQTENQYNAIAYYKGPLDRYFRAIGFTTQNSTEIRN